MNNVDNMNQGSSKPRMLYLAQDYRGVLVPNNMEPIVYRIENWLSHFFDVVRVGTHCSLAREIETHRPDLILFDGFIEGCQRKVFTITDLYTHPEIPRAWLCRVDSLSPSRYALFEYFNMVGAQSVFVLGDMTMSESCPDFVDKIFYIPQFIDASVYRD